MITIQLTPIDLAQKHIQETTRKTSI